MKSRLHKSHTIKLFGIFLLFFTFLLFFLNNSHFIDENDNFVGGMIVASGGDVYSVHSSQHMPIFYYICAIFRLLGADSIVEFRLFFFLFLAILWVIMYQRYSKHFGEVTMITYPIGYCIIMSYFLPCSATAISDQLQAQGMVILFLEFILYVNTKKINIFNYIWISISVLISFGTAFVSIFAIFIIGISVVVIEIQECFKNKKGIIESVSYLFMKYWKLILFVSSPFILLLAWYALTNNLYNFYYQAYKINTTIYPEYLGGYGTSPILSIFQGVDNYFGYFCEGMKQLLLDTSFGIRILLNIFINIAFIFFVFKKNNTAKISIFLFTLMCAPRGFIGFHSMAYYGVTLIMGTILLDNLIKNHLKEMTWKEKSILLFALFNFITPFFLHFSEILRVPSVLKNKDTKSGYGLIIQELTDENDKIYVTSLDIGIYIDSNRIPVISSPSSVPWMYRALGEKELRFVNQYKPKVAVFDKNFEVWGYKQAQYAPEILTFIKSNYTNLDLPDVPFLYVRNDYLKEAKARLGIKPIIYKSSEPTDIIGALISDRTISQYFKCNENFISEISIRIGTYARNNNSHLNMQIYDTNTKRMIFENDYNVKDFIDNQFNKLPINCQINAGTVYELRMTSINESEDNCITIYHTAEGTATDSMYAVIDGEKQNYNLCLNIYGKD